MSIPKVPPAPPSIPDVKQGATTPDKKVVQVARGVLQKKVSPWPREEVRMVYGIAQKWAMHDEIPIDQALILDIYTDLKEKFPHLVKIYLSVIFRGFLGSFMNKNEGSFWHLFGMKMLQPYLYIAFIKREFQKKVSDNIWVKMGLLIKLINPNSPKIPPIPHDMVWKIEEVSFLKKCTTSTCFAQFCLKLFLETREEGICSIELPKELHDFLSSVSMLKDKFSRENTFYINNQIIKANQFLENASQFLKNKILKKDFEISSFLLKNCTLSIMHQVCKNVHTQFFSLFLTSYKGLQNEGQFFESIKKFEEEMRRKRAFKFKIAKDAYQKFHRMIIDLLGAKDYKYFFRTDDIGFKAATETFLLLTIFRRAIQKLPGCLKGVREGLLDKIKSECAKIPPSKQAEFIDDIQEELFNAAIPFYAFVLLLEEVKRFSKELSPDEMIPSRKELMDIMDFDELKKILKKKPLPPKTEEPIIHPIPPPPVIHPKKPVVLVELKRSPRKIAISTKDKTRKILAKLKKMGFFRKRSKGSHITMVGPKGQKVTIPMHGGGGRFKLKTARSIIKQADGKGSTS